MDAIGEDAPAWKQFEEIVVRILESNNFIVSQHLPQGRLGYDLDATFGGQSWAIEVKFYRSVRAQMTLIEAAAARVLNNSLDIEADRAALIVSSVISGEQRLSLEAKYPIVFIDRADLLAMIAGRPELSDELNSILEVRSDFLGQINAPMGSGDRFRTSRTSTERRSPEARIGRDLADRLKTIRPGKADAMAYESLCVEILKYLFDGELVGWKQQQRTSDALHRFDCVCRAKPTHEFWRFIVEDIGSRYVLFEFKNYRRPITQGQVLTTEKYLFAAGLRKVAFLLTREGADVGAELMTKGAMRESGKLMLVLDDAAIVDMLEKRDSGVDPTDIMFDRTDEFMLTLSR